MLREFRPTKPFLVGIDSDGCVFDTMEIKHKECFVPMFIKHFGLQAVSRFARAAWEFVNLYSKSRGINRFPALSNTLNFLAARPEVTARAVQVPSTDALDEWLSRETRLSNQALEEEIDRGNAELAPVLAWSREVNQMIEDIVHGVPPFPWVLESLEALMPVADVVVVSQTPTDALQREWSEHRISRYAQIIAGQELGTKTQHLKLVAGNKYEPRHVLMIGDAPSDFKAAKTNSALFYPIVPWQEEQSWARFQQEGLNRFLSDSFTGEYETALLQEFNATLPDKPAW